MKNIEKYEKEISKLVYEDNILPCAIATVAGIRKEKPCYHQECEECHKKCLEWMYSEYREKILTEEEKAIVRDLVDVLTRFKCVPFNIELDGYTNYTFIRIWGKNENGSFVSLTTPTFYHKKMFTGMVTEKEYTLEELGITCQTQKDS